jgi:hypothetical protein
VTLSLVGYVALRLSDYVSIWLYGMHLCDPGAVRLDGFIAILLYSSMANGFIALRL